MVLRLLPFVSVVILCENYPAQLDCDKYIHGQGDVGLAALASPRSGGCEMSRSYFLTGHRTVLHTIVLYLHRYTTIQFRSM
jgi:hypothetical protein